jgi:hypothetical protein
LRMVASMSWRSGERGASMPTPAKTLACAWATSSSSDLASVRRSTTRGPTWRSALPRSWARCCVASLRSGVSASMVPVAWLAVVVPHRGSRWPATASGQAADGWR